MNSLVQADMMARKKKKPTLLHVRKSSSTRSFDGRRSKNFAPFSPGRAGIFRDEALVVQSGF